MKKRIFVIFLLFLILSSITYAEAREVKTLKELFNNIKEIFITGRVASGSSPTPIIVGVDEKLPIQEDLLTKETVTCYFYHNSIMGEQKCYEGSGRFSCSGLDSCSVDVYGNEGEYLNWKSTCNDQAYHFTTIDGFDEGLGFDCGFNNPPQIVGFPALPNIIYAGQNYVFSWTARDPDNDPLQWEVDWGDGEPSESGTCSIPNCFTYITSKTWNYAGYYSVSARVFDSFYGNDYHNFKVMVFLSNQTNTTVNGPDLAVTNIGILNNPIVNQETLFSAIIKNLGNRNAYGYGVSVDYGSEGGFGFGSPRIILPQEIISLNFSHNYTLQGEYTFSVNATTSNDTNLRNNFLSRTFRVNNQIQNGSIIINKSTSKGYLIELGENIAGNIKSSKIPKEINHYILDTLFDGNINFGNRFYHTAELVELGQYDNASTQTSLAGPFPDDDYQSRMVMVSKVDAIKAYYAFLDPINLNEIRSSNPLTIKFLGKEIKILMINDMNSFVAEVDGVTNVYHDLDPFINEDPDDPRWIWDIGNLNVIDKTTIVNEPNAPITPGPGPFIGIELDHNFRDGGDEPAVEKGQCISLPNRYANVCFDGLSIDDEYNKNFISRFVENIDLSSDSGVPGYSNANAIEFAIELRINLDNGFKLIKASFNNLTTNLTEDKLTDVIWIVNGSAVFFKDPSNGRKRFAGSILGYNFGTQIFAQINTQSSPSTSDDDKINLKLGDNGLFVSLEVSDLDENLTSTWYKEFNRKMVNSLGRTRFNEEADELRWQRGFGYNIHGFNLGVKDEDHRMRYGIIIDEPRSNGAQDQVVLNIPPQQIKEIISVKGGYVASSSIKEQKSEEQQIQSESYKTQEQILQEREQIIKQEQAEREQQKPKENFLTRFFEEFFDIFKFNSFKNLFGRSAGEKIKQEQIQNINLENNYEVYSTKEDLSKYFNIKTNEQGYLEYTNKDTNYKIITPINTMSSFSISKNSLYKNYEEKTAQKPIPYYYGTKFRNADTFDSKASLYVNYDNEGINGNWLFSFGRADRRIGFREYENVYGWRKDYYEKIGPFELGTGPIFIRTIIPELSIEKIRVGTTLRGTDYYYPDLINHIIEVNEITFNQILGNYTVNDTGVLYNYGERYFRLRNSGNDLEVFSNVDWGPYAQARNLIISTFLVDNVIPFNGNNWEEIINMVNQRLSSFGENIPDTAMYIVVEYNPDKNDNTKWFISYPRYYDINWNNLPNFPTFMSAISWRDDLLGNDDPSKYYYYGNFVLTPKASAYIGDYGLSSYIEYIGVAPGQWKYINGEIINDDVPWFKVINS